MENKDQQWSEASAKTSEGNETSLLNLEASAVRRAMLKRRESIEKESKKFDFVQFEKLRMKLIQSGHLTSESNSKSMLRRKITLVGTYIAGMISSGLLILGLTSQLMVTRSAVEPSLIERLRAAVGNWNLEDRSEISKTITMLESDPFSIAHTLEEKAWEAGLHTKAYIENGVINLKIININSRIETSEIKLLLGLHPEFNGSVVVKISK